MNSKKLVLAVCGGLAGFLLLLSEFLPWFSNHSAIQLSYWRNFIPEYFIYLSPLLAGLIFLISVVLLIWKNPSNIIIPLLLIFSSITLMLVFIIDFLQLDHVYLNSVQIGFYICLGGVFLQFFCAFFVLSSLENWKLRGGEDH